MVWDIQSYEDISKKQSLNELMMEVLLEQPRLQVGHPFVQNLQDTVFPKP